MPAATQQVQGNRVKRCPITIPANAGTAVTLESLCLAATYTGGERVLTPRDVHNIVGGAVKSLPAAIIAGDNATDLPETVLAGTVYSEPAVNFLKATFVKAAAGAAISAVVSVYLAGDEI